MESHLEKTVYQMFETLYFHPFHYDQKKKRIVPDRKMRKYLFHFSTVLSCIYIIFIVLRFLQSSESNVETVLLHISWILGFSTTTSFHLIGFLQKNEIAGFLSLFINFMAKNTKSGNDQKLNSN